MYLLILTINKVFNGSSILENKEEYIEWAIGWPQGIENEFLSFCPVLVSG